MNRDDYALIGFGLFMVVIMIFLSSVVGAEVPENAFYTFQNQQNRDMGIMHTRLDSMNETIHENQNQLREDNFMFLILMSIVIFSGIYFIMRDVVRIELREHRRSFKEDVTYDDIFKDIPEIKAHKLKGGKK